MDIANLWDAEYQKRGIPSSYKADPSTSVRWFVDSIPYVSPGLAVRSAIDVGCGTGRNSLFLAEQGACVTGIDRSSVAIGIAKQTADITDLPVTFLEHDLVAGLPTDDQSMDAVIDTFVFFHLVRTQQRVDYLQELQRVLRPGGLLLLTLATTDDDYYGKCPSVEGWEEWSDVKVVVDPEADITNVLYSEDEFMGFVGERFELSMTWRKRMKNVMHGADVERSTLCTIWRKCSSSQLEFLH